jgi:putative FmdB family regulatory protein
MPTYQYKCDDCGVCFDRFQHFSEQPLQQCPECPGMVRRVIQPVGIIFKGSGFYVTDNKKSSALTSKVEAKADTEAKAEPKTPAVETKSKPAGETAKAPADS